MTDSQRRWFLVAGLALPVIVLGLAVALAAFERSQAQTPQYSLLFVTTRYDGDGQGPVFTDADGEIHVQFAGTQQVREALFLWDHDSGDYRALPLPETPEVTTNPSLSSLLGLELIPGPESPDGYRVQLAGSGGGGIIREVFGGRRHDGFTIESGPVRIWVEDRGDLGAPWTVRALGWVADE